VPLDAPGIKGSMYKVMKTFICKGCMNAVSSTGCSSVDIGVNANLELVDQFCYFGDMLSVDGGADAAVENRIRIGWNKFRQLVALLTNYKDISLKVRGRLYSSCVRSGMLPRFSEIHRHTKLLWKVLGVKQWCHCSMGQSLTLRPH